MPERKGLLTTLAEHEVPPMPVRLNERVHQRLNRALLVTHFVDLLAGALPYLAGHLLRGVGHLIGATISGRFESDRVGRSREAP